MSNIEYLVSSRLAVLDDIVQSTFLASPHQSYAHHTRRVANYTARISRSIGANPELAVAAALVHDVGVTVDPTFLGHIGQTAVLAPALLQESGYTVWEAEAIVKIAVSHHPTPTMTLVEPLEQCLFDADGLDIVGIFGFLRWHGDPHGDMNDLSASAKLFLSIHDQSVTARGRYFYTLLGQSMGEVAMAESCALCRSLLNFLAAAEEQAATLSPVSFSAALGTDIPR